MPSLYGDVWSLVQSPAVTEASADGRGVESESTWPDKEGGVPGVLNICYSRRLWLLPCRVVFFLRGSHGDWWTTVLCVGFPQGRLCPSWSSKGSMREVTTGLRQPARSFTLKPRPATRAFRPLALSGARAGSLSLSSGLLPPMHGALFSLCWRALIMSPVLGLTRHQVRTYGLTS